MANLEWHKPYEQGERKIYEDSTWGRWMIYTQSDGTYSVRDMGNDGEYLEGDFTSLEEAKAAADREYNHELEEVGLGDSGYGFGF